MVAGLHRWHIKPLSRAAHFTLLALLLATTNTYASTVSASLFLARVGAEALPIYYMLFAALSIPVSILFSVTIDRWPRARILMAMLGLFGVIGAGLAIFVGDRQFDYYALYVGISVSELLLYSVYYVLIADYFTTTEHKRSAGKIAMAMAGGGWRAGFWSRALSDVLGPRLALYGVPLLVGVTLAHLFWIATHERPLDESESAAEESIVESLRIMPRIAARYPIVGLLAAAVFVNIVLQCLSEYLAFSIYVRDYPQEEALASFLASSTRG